MKFLHTADLQLGERFTQFGEAASALRAARVQTLRRLLELARAEAVDFVLIAGDMFENDWVAPDLVREACGILAEHPELPVYILPGNHDPCHGPGCLWLREPFLHPPENVTVLSTPAPVRLAGGVLLPSPITQKQSMTDPSACLAAMAATATEPGIKIGVTHGSLAIEGKHQPNDHPIALDAASRAGLDYLAVGHWHTWQTLDDGRLVMPGAPEPDQFGQDGAGSAALVELAAPGATPVVRRIPCATLTWHALECDFLDASAARMALDATLNDLSDAVVTTVLRVTLTGATSPDEHRAMLEWLTERTQPFLAVVWDDRSTLELSEQMFAALLREHPLLAQTFADLERGRLFVSGTPSPVATDAVEAMTLADFQALCGQEKIPIEALDEATFQYALALMSRAVSQLSEADGGAHAH